MKFFMLLLFFVLSSSIFALDENPARFCDQNPECTENMKQIISDYKTGNAQFAKASLSGFSGGCYHINSLYDSSHEHHGAFIFERSQSDLMADGAFNFFFENDYFEGMTSQEMKEWFISQNSQMAKTIQKSKQIELQFLGDQSDYHYWFRNNKENNKLLLIGKQQNDAHMAFVFCQLNRHN